MSIKTKAGIIEWMKYTLPNIMTNARDSKQEDLINGLNAKAWYDGYVTALNNILQILGEDKK